MFAIIWILSDTPVGMMSLSVDVSRNSRIFAGFYPVDSFYDVRYILETMGVKQVILEDTLAYTWTSKQRQMFKNAFAESSVKTG